MAAAALVCLCTTAFARPADAQVNIKVLGGLTSAAERQPFFGGAIGAGVGWIELDVEAGRMTDILPSGLLDRLNDLQRQRGLPVRAIAKMPATYVAGNLRIMAPAGPVRPFVSVGTGIARLEPRFDVSVVGISLGDVFGAVSVEPRTETLVAVGAGLRLHFGETGLVEAGYRYMVVFTDFGLESGFNVGRPDVSVVYGALGFRF